MGWQESDIPDQTGRVAIVTGANSGIGFETARALAGRGARVVLACRSPERGRDAEERLRKALPAADARFEALDLGSLASVRAFAERFAGDESRLDILCNNAGVMMCPRGTTEDGFETQFGTNHLGHFLLTGLLWDRIASTPGARVVSLSSLMHLVGRIDFRASWQISCSPGSFSAASKGVASKPSPPPRTRARPRPTSRPTPA
jgi:NAD(P)-dependent dehydrogenase (short-subunit alcohol dehydrogenase family)